MLSIIDIIIPVGELGIILSIEKPVDSSETYRPSSRDAITLKVLKPESPSSIELYNVSTS